MNRLITILLFSFIIMGYRRDSDDLWKVKDSSPTIWLKFCNEIQDQDFKRKEAPSGDDVRDYDDASFENVIQTVVDDFNNVSTSYIRLALYPDDPDDPGDPEEGDTRFTRKKAKERTIDICIQSSGSVFEGGHALPDFEDDIRVACEIVLSKTLNDDLVPFVQTLTHEIGHCLGLTHPQSTKHSVMSYFNARTDMRLQIHDKIGLSHLYPHKDFNLKENNTFGLSCGFAE